MLLRFIKNWTLPVAIAFGTLAYLLFAFTPELELLAGVLGPLCETLLPVSIFLTLFVTFSKVDFHKMRLHRWQGVILLLQLVLVGILVLLIYNSEHLTDFPEHVWLFDMFTLRDMIYVMEAVLVCVVAPCASSSPVVTAKLGGDLSQMTAFVLLSSSVVSVLIPLAFPLIEPRPDVAFLPAFLAIFRRLATVLLLPLLLGAIVRHWVRPLYEWFVHTPDLAFYLWCISLSITSGITVRNIVHSEASVVLLLVIAVLALLTSFIQFAIGRAIGHRLGQPVCCGQGMFQKNTGLSIWIAYTYLTPIASIGAGCYVLWQNLINSYELWLKRTA